MSLLRGLALAAVGCLLAMSPVSADEVYVGNGDEKRLAVLRQRVRVAPSALAWEELALQLIALKRDEAGARPEIVRALREAYRRRPTAQNCYYLFVFTGKKAYLQQALEIEPYSLGLYAAAEEAKLQSSAALRKAKAYSEAYDRLTGQPWTPGSEWEDGRGVEVPWRDGVLYGPGWQREVAASELKVQVVGLQVLAITPERVRVFRLADGAPVGEWKTPVEFPEAEHAYGPQRPGPFDFWEESSSGYLGCGEEYLLLRSSEELYMVSLRSGQGWGMFSGGQRGGPGVLRLAPGESRVIFFDWAGESVSCLSSADGTVLWSHRPEVYTNSLPIYCTPTRLGVLEEISGKVFEYELATGRLLSKRPLKDVVLERR